VEQLTERTNESAFFGVLEPMAVKVAAAQPSRLPLRYILDVGERVALHASALGKALLGLIPPDAARARLQCIERRAVTPHTVVDIDPLMAQLARGRELGWYEARDEGTEGVTALAVAGWLGDQPVGISLAGPADRIEKNRENYLAALSEVRNSLLADS
jgi:DNA-binding IclR family transcriptional regulator